MEKLPKPLGTGTGWPKTSKQRKLCWLVVVEGLSVKAAAEQAGYSKLSARNRSHELFNACSRYAEQLQQSKNQIIEKKFEVTVDSVVDELTYLAFASLKDFVTVIDFNGMKRAIGKPINELTEQQGRAIESWEVRELTCPVTKAKYLDYRYTLYGKDGSLMHLGKHLGMFNDKMIIERRMVKVHKVDLSDVPDNVLEKWMGELTKYSQGKRVIEGKTG